MSSSQPSVVDVTAEGHPALRRATLSVALAQLVSWGVLFYAIPVAAPAIGADTGWSPAIMPALLSLALLIAAFGAPLVARAMARAGGRAVLLAGSGLGVAAMLVVASARHPVIFLIGFCLLGVAMASSLYEPAMAVLVALDPDQRARTLAAVTVAGGLASTVYAPLTAACVDALGWRLALVALGTTGGIATACLHRSLPPGARAGTRARVEARHLPAGYRQLRLAQQLETTANVATTAAFVALLVALDVGLGAAGVLLATTGIGKTLGRLLLVGGVVLARRLQLVVVCCLVQFSALAVPLLTVDVAVLAAAAAVAGAAGGITTVLRPLLVIDLVGTDRFPAVNARLQRAAGVPRAFGPAVVGFGAAAIGWHVTWLLALSLLLVAAAQYRRIGPLLTTPMA